MENNQMIDLAASINNTVRYEIYLTHPPDNQLIERYQKFVTSVISNYERDFKLEKHEKQSLLYGSLDFDENIEDEWLIVYILYELSKYDHDSVIRVYDNDGDILLIEAAEYLPRWLESSKSKNRVFIHKAKLHIIPEHIKLKDLYMDKQTSGTITQLAAQFVRDMNRVGHSSNKASGIDSSLSGVRTLAQQSIQDAIKEQLSGMPNKEAWISKKFKQLDEIISENNEGAHLQKKFKESLTLASVVAMDEDELQVSPLSSVSSSSLASSSSWLTEHQDD